MFIRKKHELCDLCEAVFFKKKCQIQFYGHFLNLPATSNVMNEMHLRCITHFLKSHHEQAL